MTELTGKVEPVARRWNVDEYYQMAEIGLFRGQRVELIAGEVLKKYPPSAIEAMCLALIHVALQDAFGQAFTIRVQFPLRLNNNTEPEPDLAVVPGSPRDYPDHPTTAVLVVEVAATSLAFDRKQKASLYARAGVGEYWVLNISHRQLEVHREPGEDLSQPFGFGYRQTSLLSAKDAVSPLSRPNVCIAVESLLP